LNASYGGRVMTCENQGNYDGESLRRYQYQGERKGEGGRKK